MPDEKVLKNQLNGKMNANTISTIQEALEHYYFTASELALTLAEEDGYEHSSEKQADILRFWGKFGEKTDNDLQNIKRKEVHLKEALKMQIANPVERIRTLKDVGDHCLSKDSEEAKMRYEEELVIRAVFRKVNDPIRFRLLKQVADLYLCVKEYESTEKYCKQSIIICSEEWQLLQLQTDKNSDEQKSILSFVATFSRNEGKYFTVIVQFTNLMHEALRAMLKNTFILNPDKLIKINTKQ